MKTKILIHEKRVRIYFRSGHHFIRYNTKIPALSKSEFYRNEPNNLFHPLTEVNVKRNKKIKEIQGFIENIIDENLGKLNVTINNQFIKNRLSYTHSEMLTKKYLIEFYADFLQEKKEYYSNPRFSQTSLRDYTSLFQSLMDYQIVNNHLLKVENFKDDWAKSFLDFLSKKTPSTADYNTVDNDVCEILKHNLECISLKKAKYRFRDKYIKYISQGELGDNTIKKRVDTLNEFQNYLIKHGIVETENIDIKELRKKYTEYDIAFTTLKIEEVNSLYHFEIKNDHPDGRYHYVRDLLIFMCLTSFRYSDVISFDMTRDIHNGKIKKVLQKTRKYRAKSIIKITPILKEIFERYDYKLDRYSNTLYNRYLKEFLKESGLFSEDFVPIKLIQGVEQKLEPIPRYEAIASHTGRRSCITNLVYQDFPAEKIRILTGHSTDKIMQMYVDRDRNEGEANDALLDWLDSAMKDSATKRCAKKNNQ